MATNTIIPLDEALAIREVQTLSNIVTKLRETVFQADKDYGIIPGTSNPTLLQPGMEKLLRALRLRAEFIEASIIEDFEKPLFHYKYECRLTQIDTNQVISTAKGSCNSMESKYRWRKAERVCPTCEKPAIIKGKAEYGGGWLCWKKRDGCGAKFSENDEQITSQPEGRVANPDIFDQVNTIDKMAQKRALASAIKSAANVSEWFTVDLEDIQYFAGTDVIDAEIEMVDKTTPPTAHTQGNSSVTPPVPVSAPKSSKARGEAAEAVRNSSGKWALGDLMNKLLPAYGKDTTRMSEDIDTLTANKAVVIGEGEIDEAVVRFAAHQLGDANGEKANPFSKPEAEAQP